MTLEEWTIVEWITVQEWTRHSKSNVRKSNSIELNPGVDDRGSAWRRDERDRPPSSGWRDRDRDRDERDSLPPSSWRKSGRDDRGRKRP